MSLLTTVDPNSPPGTSARRSNHDSAIDSYAVGIPATKLIATVQRSVAGIYGGLMGANSWFGLGDWQGSVQATLAKVQSDLLASSELLSLLPDREMLLALGEDLLLLGDFLESDVALVRQAMAGLDEDGRPATRQHAVALCAPEMGTSTVLDIDVADSAPRHVDTPGPKGQVTASPLTEAELLDLFDTLGPATGDLSKASTLETLWGDARYVVGYENDTPAAVLFVGASGD